MEGRLVRKKSEDTREIDAKRIRTLIDQATLDSFDESDDQAGLLSSIREEVVVPFWARLDDEDVKVIRFEWPDKGYGLNAVCKSKRGAKAKEAAQPVLRDKIDKQIRDLLRPTKEKIERELSEARTASNAIRESAIGSLQAALNIKILELCLDFDHYRKAHCDIRADVLSHVIEGNAPSIVFSIPQNYTSKKLIVRELNEMMRPWDAAIWSDKLKEPCILVASGSRDGQGRYVLQGRITKKRVEAYKSIADLLPIKLVPDAPRKEGFIERRKSRELDEDETLETRIVNMDDLEWIEPFPKGYDWIEAYYAWREEGAQLSYRDERDD